LRAFANAFILRAAIPERELGRFRSERWRNHVSKLFRQLSLPIFHNSALTWLAALATAGVLYLALLTVKRLVRRHHERMLATARIELMDIPLEVLSHTSTLFAAAVSIFIGLQLLAISDGARHALDTVITLALFWQAGLWASAAVTTWLERKRKTQLAIDRAAASSIAVVAFIARAVVWVMVVLLALENLGVNITTLVAGLGVGGVAVALAVQNILGDLFASLSITFDQPFFVGDFVTVDSFLGSVEHIGIKSTRLRSITGEQIVMSNADLLKSRLRNYGRMTERRVLFTIGVTYDTPVEKLEQIPKMIRSIIESQEGTRFDRSHFSSHGACSLDFETVYYVLSADYKRHMDIQQAVRLQIHREFDRIGIEFAYPTQRLILERAAAPTGAQAPAPAAALLRTRS
jgi:small-conductance mechanosensitive channel